MKRYLLPHAVMLATASLLLWSAARLQNYSDTQALYYNRGCDLMETGNILKALEAFEKSIDAYERSREHHFPQSLFEPRGWRRFAALAWFRRGDLYKDTVGPDKLELPLKEIKQGLHLNPGAGDQSGVREDELDALALEQYYAAVNIEQIFKQRPDLAQGESKQGNPGAGKKPGDKPAERVPADKRKSVEPGKPGSINDI